MSSTITGGALASIAWWLVACGGPPAAPPRDATVDVPSDTAHAPVDASANDVTARDDAAGDVAPTDAARTDAAPTDAARTDAAAPDPCGGALFCETFDSYGATTFHDGQLLGPWQAALTATGATMALDGTHTVSGPRALHTHIDTGVTGGGRLFSYGALPILASHPTHLYGRMMMYIDPNGTSIHWSFFGEDGVAYPGSPPSGRYSAFLISSLLRGGTSKYSFVYNLGSSATEPTHDCNTAAPTSLPSATWSCLAFELDSVAHRLRLSIDGSPILAIDDHGQACTTASLSGDTWYGPVLNRFYAGAWSFHAMNAPLDVWIDDVVLDTSPVACPGH